MSIITHDDGGGVVELRDQWLEPQEGDVPLVARKVAMLPPIDAILNTSGEDAAALIASAKFEQQYEQVYQAEHPIYGRTGAFAMLGGWHFPFPDGDWNELIGDELLVTTFKNAEPWVETWITRGGQFRVVCRIT